MRRLVLAVLVVAMPTIAAAEVTLFPTSSRLIGAAAADDLATVRQDLLVGDNPNLTEIGTERTALMYAAIAGDVPMVTLLLNNGARIDQRDQLGNTSLHWAAQKGTDAVVSLLDAGAQINAQNRDGATPLMLASETGRLDAVRVLLARKASLTIRDYTGRTALARAEAGRQPRVQQVLEKAGATL